MAFSTRETDGDEWVHECDEWSDSDSDRSSNSFNSNGDCMGKISYAITPVDTGRPHIFYAKPNEFRYLIERVVSDARKTEKQRDNDPLTVVTDFPDIVANPIKYTDVLIHIMKRARRTAISLQEKHQILDYLIKIHEKYETPDLAQNLTMKYLEATVRSVEGKFVKLADIEENIQKYLGGRQLRQSELYLALKQIFTCNDREERRQAREKEAADKAREEELKLQECAKNDNKIKTGKKARVVKKTRASSKN